LLIYNANKYYDFEILIRSQMVHFCHNIENVCVCRGILFLSNSFHTFISNIPSYHTFYI